MASKPPAEAPIATIKCPWSCVFFFERLITKSVLPMFCQKI
jgi:hypothetical protein